MDSKDSKNKDLVSLILEKLYVNFGKEILKVIQGYVSTEVDARLSYDTDASIESGRRIIKLYEEEGISRDRILIKVAATWEGIKAAEVLEKEGIHCNLTLIFTIAQALACADANITLISPFVGRINDGHIKKYGKQFLPHEEPGVRLVKQIHEIYRKYNYKTIIMAASVRTPESVMELAGCDRITMPPTIIEQLEKLVVNVDAKLLPNDSPNTEGRKHIDEKTFRWEVNEDEIGNEKLADGIRVFAKDAIKLEKMIRDKLEK